MTAKTGVDFALDLRALVQRTKDKAELVVSNTIVAVGTSLVMKSPVGDPSLWKKRIDKNGSAHAVKPPKGYEGGHFRANWQYGFNVPASGKIDVRDAAGTATIADMADRVAMAGSNGIHFIVNNLPYSVKLEYGHSSQAPAGIVGVTLVEFNDIANRAVADVQ